VTRCGSGNFVKKRSLQCRIGRHQIVLEAIVIAKRTLMMKFSDILLQVGNNTGIEVPSDVLEALGSKRAAVKIDINGYRYRSTIGAMGGKALIPFSSEHRKASGIKGGDAIEVTLEKDDEPRTVEIPDDLASALAVSPNLRSSFNALSPSARKAHTLSVESAKTAETRQKRIDKILASLA
jgi:hypothetical protein